MTSDLKQRPAAIMELARCDLFGWVIVHERSQTGLTWEKRG